MASNEIKVFSTGTVNRPDTLDIKKDAAKNSLGFITTDGKLELARGRDFLGTEGGVGKATSVHIGFKVDGTAVIWRKIKTKIQHWNGTTWVDTITGLLETDLFSFANYSSLAGNFTLAGSPTAGLYKFSNANPASSINLYDAAKNFKGYIFIDKGRTLLWGRTEDKTGLYGSWLDKQNSTVYTTVSAEATTASSGTLAFKAGGATRNCFGVKLTLTGSGEVFTDNYLGVLTGSLGNTGTINYITGAYTLSVGGTGTADYQWENSNIKGVSDFTYSATRVAGEGFILPQDIGGDATQIVLLSSDGNYVSLKKTSAYEYRPDANDLNPTNEVVRANIGVPSRYAAVSTDKGVVFINTAQPNRPELTILQRNPLGENLVPSNIAEHFAWENYEYDEAVMTTYGHFVLLSCKTADASANDRTLLIDPNKQTVDILPYGVSSFAKNEGTLYGGSAVTESVNILLDGFDDLNEVIENFWESVEDEMGATRLKKFLRFKIRGYISQNQSLQVYESYDGDKAVLIGTVSGTGFYVDSANTIYIGSTMVGEAEVGGEGGTEAGYYEAQFTRLVMPKFRKRSLQFKATGIGYVSILGSSEDEIQKYEDRIPTKYRIDSTV